MARELALDTSKIIGRIDDVSTDGMDLIADIREIYDNYGFETQIPRSAEPG